MTMQAEIQAILKARRYSLGSSGPNRDGVDGMLGSLSLAAILAELKRGQPASLKPSEDCARLIKSFEGCKLTAYPDPGTGGDPWTIGWGSTGPGIKKGVTWTQAEADARFDSDLREFAEQVAAQLDGAATTQAQFDAMVSFAYNVGVGAFADSTLLRKHKAGDYAGARAEFGRWINSGGKPMNGLVRRRAAEARMYGGEA